VKQKVEPLADTSNRRLAITLEINALSALQIKAVKDATFMGWDAQEKVAYEERSKRIFALRAEMFHLDGTAPGII
jgi:hypothetical protein